MLRLLAIGGSGIIGSSLHQLAKKLPPFCTFDDYSKENADLSTPQGLESLKGHIAKRKYNVAIVLAAQKRQLGDSAELLTVNNIITDNICRALSDANLHIVYISSCAVYGEKNQQENYNEKSPLNPTSFYGEHKVYSENIYQANFKPSRVLILRPPVIYHSSSQGYDPFGLLFNAKTYGKIRLWGDGSEKREFIYVEEASNAILHLSSQKISGIYNLVSGHSYSFMQIADRIVEVIPAIILQAERDFATVDHTYDAVKLCRLLGEAAFTSPLDIISNAILRGRR